MIVCYQALIQSGSSAKSPYFAEIGSNGSYYVDTNGYNTIE